MPPTGKKKTAAPEEPKDGRKKPRKGKTRELVECLVVAGVLALGIRTFAFQIFKIPTRSMEPELIGNENYGDRVVAAMWYNRGGAMLPLKLARPDRWQVIVFDHYYIVDRNTGKKQRTNFIKRLVGLPGEQVEIRDGDIWAGPPGKIEVQRKPPDVQDQVWMKLCDLDMGEPWKLPYYWTAAPRVEEDSWQAAAPGWRFECDRLVGASTAQTAASLHWTSTRYINDRFIRLTAREVDCPNPDCPRRIKTKESETPYRFKAVFDNARPMAFCPACHAPVWGVRDREYGEVAWSPGVLVANPAQDNDYWTEDGPVAFVPDTKLVLDFENLGGAGELEVVLTGRAENYTFTLPLGGGDARAVLALPGGAAEKAPLCAAAGRHRLEVSNVDGVFSASLDGNAVRREYLPSAPPGLSDAAFSVRKGGRIALTRVQLFRDLYYAFGAPGGNGSPPDPGNPDQDLARGFKEWGVDTETKRFWLNSPLGQDEVFFLGDNTLASQDSRVFGPKKTSKIVARAIFVLWPASRWHMVW